MDSTDIEKVFLSAAQGIADNLVHLDASTALFPGGRNGPYFDLESPVRNSAHALCAMSVAYSITGDTSFATEGRSLAGFLLTDQAFSLGSHAVHRQKHPKDWCNGVIGPAWLIESLAWAGELLGLPQASERARELALSQPFDREAALWRRRDPKRGVGGADRTLNHQVYFAAAAAAATRSSAEGPVRSVDAFLDHLATGGFRVHADGLIVHHVPRNDESPTSLRGARERLLRVARNSPTVHRLRGNSAGTAPDARERDHGYHLYSLFSLANLRTFAPDHKFWRSSELLQALSFVTRPGWLASLDANRYAYPYNGPGLELPLIARLFADLEPQLPDLAAEALREQINRTWDAPTQQFARTTDDRLTLAARSYELGLALAPSPNHSQRSVN